MGFLGEHEIRLDDKGRARIPSSLKDKLSPKANNKFVVTRGFENCLLLYPYDVWETVTEELKKLNTFVKENRDFLRRFMGGATELTMDGNDRVNLPNHLLDYANIKKEIILAPQNDKYEIWDKKTYDDLMNSDNGSSYEELAERVMGKINR